jgi:pyrimidine-nucleoside phosphorylase
MRAVDVIVRKRDRNELSTEEIRFLIDGFARGEIPDYQMSAWAMAVLINGMSARETTDLTLAIVDSGDRIDLSGVVPFAVDKHSTGGVGDKTTLVVQPLVAACGVPVGKMSGRGLGFTGGTLDKLESIPGMRVDFTTEEFILQLRKEGLVLTGQTADLAPADGKLYALRDVTGTVPSIPLIASSVMSKKIAGGAQGIVLDVKVGSGAFMRSLDQAVELAQCMVEIGRLAERRVAALISDMNQPLGHAVGNANEVREAIDTLRGDGPEDFREHCIVLASQMLAIAGQVESPEAARGIVKLALDEGEALEKFRVLVAAQGGDVRVIDDVGLLPSAGVKFVVVARESGYVSALDAGEIGLAAMGLGAGRAVKGDKVDHGVGLACWKKIGDPVEQGEAMYEIYARTPEAAQVAAERLLSATRISSDPVEPLPLFYSTIQ